MIDETIIGMQLLTPEQVAKAMEEDPNRWIAIQTGKPGPAYGCGNCAAPLVLGISIHALNRGIPMEDGIPAYGATIRCSTCGILNGTTKPVTQYLDASSLFLHTMDDLKHRSRDGSSEYDSLMAALLLRKLLLEENTITDQVNRIYRIPIIYTVNAPLPWVYESKIKYQVLLLDDFDPDTAQYTNIVNLKRSQFLNYEIMNLSPDSVSVHNLIDYVCHIEGSVHVKKPSTDLEIALAERRDTIRIDEKPFWAAALPAVGRIVHKALKPLEQAILTNRPDLNKDR